VQDSFETVNFCGGYKLNLVSLFGSIILNAVAFNSLHDCVRFINSKKFLQLVK